MNKPGINLQEPLAELPVETLARLARIRVLAREARRNAAIRKHSRPPGTAKTEAHKPKPSKAQKPYFYNPSHRD